MEDDDVTAAIGKNRHSRRMLAENGDENAQAIDSLENTDKYDQETIEGGIIMEKSTLNDEHFVDDEYSDSQHALILRSMANVYEYLLAGITGQDLLELLDRLDTHCKLHFLDEEKEMEKMDFPAIEEHKAQHALFVMHLRMLPTFTNVP